MSSLHAPDTQPVPSYDGRVTAHAALAPYTWFRVGGAAEILYSPHDTAALAEAMRDWGGAVLPIGVGSNDGSVRTMSNADLGFAYRECTLPDEP